MYMANKWFSRTALPLILAKFGAPPHFVRIIQRLHTDVVAKFKVGEEEVEIANTSGTKQGDPLAAILFLFIIQACLETLVLPKLQLYTAAENVEGQKGRGVTGMNWRKKGGRESFSVWCSLYADDAGNMFDTREEIERGSVLIFEHFAKFGLSVHVGRDLDNGGADSKTEAMYVPPAGGDYDTEDTSPLHVDGGLIPFTKNFTYLGSKLSFDTSCVTDVNARIAKAAAAFGALRKSVFSAKGIELKVKGKVYMALVVSILLYGSECWALRRKEEVALERFHNDCIRKMCRVSRWKQHVHHLKSSELRAQLGLRTMRHYISVRVLRWAGHVVRMDRERLPRKLLFSWVDRPRKSGGQPLTFGRRVERTVKAALEVAEPQVRRTIVGTGIVGGRIRQPGIGWINFAKERTEWRKFIYNSL